eukprot:364241-Chlamydomonas_euryale.AAC.4
MTRVTRPPVIARRAWSLLVSVGVIMLAVSTSAADLRVAMFSDSQFTYGVKTDWDRRQIRIFDEGVSTSPSKAQ